MEQDGKVYSVQFKDKSSVYSCYMSFTKDGGLFVPNALTSAPKSLGEQVMLIVKMPDGAEAFLVSGKVCWLGHGRRKGFGIRMAADDGSRRLKVAIENMLGAHIKAANPTYTM